MRASWKDAGGCPGCFEKCRFLTGIVQTSLILPSAIARLASSSNAIVSNLLWLLPISTDNESNINANFEQGFEEHIKHHGSGNPVRVLCNIIVLKQINRLNMERIIKELLYIVNCYKLWIFLVLSKQITSAGWTFEFEERLHKNVEGELLLLGFPSLFLVIRNIFFPRSLP